MLEEIEDGRLPEADFLSFPPVRKAVWAAASMWKILTLPKCASGPDEGPAGIRAAASSSGEAQEIVRRDKELQYLPAFLLDEDREVAMAKQLRIQELESHLPGLHCGSWGAPPAGPWGGECFFAPRAPRRLHVSAQGPGAGGPRGGYRRRRRAAPGPRPSSPARTRRFDSRRLFSPPPLFAGGPPQGPPPLTRTDRRPLLTPFHLAQPDRPVSGGYAGDLLSWVLGRAGQDAAWLTIMSNQNVAAVALMAEVSCVILTEGSPPTATCSAALRRRASICWGPDRDTFDTAARFVRGAGCRVMPPHSISFCYFKSKFYTKYFRDFHLHSCLSPHPATPGGGLLLPQAE